MTGLASSISVLGDAAVHAAELAPYVLNVLMRPDADTNDFPRVGRSIPIGYYGKSRPEEPPVGIIDPYDWYAAVVMRSPNRMHNLFDIAAGTRAGGPLGHLQRLGWIYGEIPELAELPHYFWTREFKKNLGGAFARHLAAPEVVQRLFQQPMTTGQAISELGAYAPFFPFILKQPENWAKVFGYGAENALERDRYRRMLQASLTLYKDLAQVPRFMPNKDAISAAAKGTPFSVLRGLYITRKPVQTDAGLQMLPDPEVLRSPSTMNPRYFSDNLEAAEFRQKFSSHRKLNHDRLLRMAEKVQKKNLLRQIQKIAEDQKPFDIVSGSAVSIAAGDTQHKEPNKKTKSDSSELSSAEIERLYNLRQKNEKKEPRASNKKKDVSSPEDLQKKWLLNSVKGLARRAQVPYIFALHGETPEVISSLNKEQLQEIWRYLQEKQSREKLAKALQKQAGILSFGSNLFSGNPISLFDFSENPYVSALSSLLFAGGLAGAGLGLYQLLKNTRHRNPRPGVVESLSVPLAQTIPVVSVAQVPTLGVIPQAAQTAQTETKAAVDKYLEKLAHDKYLEKLAFGALGRQFLNLGQTLWGAGRFGFHIASLPFIGAYRLGKGIVSATPFIARNLIWKPMSYGASIGSEMLGLTQFARRNKLYNDLLKEYGTGPTLDLLRHANRLKMQRPIGPFSLLFNPTEAISERYLPPHQMRWILEHLHTDPAALNQLRRALPANSPLLKTTTPGETVLDAMLKKYGPIASRANRTSLAATLLPIAAASAPALYAAWSAYRNREPENPVSKFWHSIGSIVDPVSPSFGEFIRENPAAMTAASGIGLGGLGYLAYLLSRQSNPQLNPQVQLQ